MKCNLCPRMCNAERTEGKMGYCRYPRDIHISKTMLHMWEEPCISGKKGSGAVFFSGCSLRCVYCQNSRIALSETGRRLSAEELAGEFLSLEEKGAHNINLVTPTHFSDGIKESIGISKKLGIKLPFVYNTGGYELASQIEKLDGSIDVYLTDFKYMIGHTAQRYSNAPDYPQHAAKSLEEMVKQHPKPVFDKSGIIREGVIVRHLLLPGNLANSKAVVEYLFKTYGDSIYISIMNQYTPVVNDDRYPELAFTPSGREYDKLVDYALSLGVRNAYIQEDGASDTGYIPDFDLS